MVSAAPTTRIYEQRCFNPLRDAKCNKLLGAESRAIKPVRTMKSVLDIFPGNCSAWCAACKCATEYEFVRDGVV